MIKFSNQLSQDNWYLTLDTQVLATYTILNWSLSLCLVEPICMDVLFKRMDCCG